VRRVPRERDPSDVMRVPQGRDRSAGKAGAAVRENAVKEHGPRENVARGVDPTRIAVKGDVGRESVAERIDAGEIDVKAHAMRGIDAREDARTVSVVREVAAMRIDARVIVATEAVRASGAADCRRCRS
jgi:hypothetical protein